MPNEVAQPTEHTKRTESELVEAWNEMVHDLKVILRLESDPIQAASMRNLFLRRQGSKELPSFPSLEHIDFKPPIRSLEQLLRTELVAWDNSFNYSSLEPRKYQLTINTEVASPKVLFNAGAKEIHFVVNIDKPTDPSAQEELLHAAQTSLWHADRTPTFLAHKTNEQLVHTSILLDMALSYAAVETGSFSQWRDRVDQQTSDNRAKYHSGYYWDKTLLGKRLNERFLYDSVSLAEIGVCWRNLGTYFDGMFNRDGEVIDQNMSMCFELGCLAYGSHHKDFAFMMVDLPIDETMSDEEAGRVVVDWAKRLMQYCEDQGITDDLLTHHTDVTELPEKYFTFVIRDSIVSDLKRAAQSEVSPLATVITFETAQRASRALHYQMVDKIAKAYTRSQESNSEGELRALLREYDVPWSKFRQAVQIATTRYEAQERTRSGEKKFSNVIALLQGNLQQQTMILPQTYLDV